MGGASGVEWFSRSARLLPSLSGDLAVFSGIGGAADVSQVPR